jgi:sugar lactone lactonase YvrE
MSRSVTLILLAAALVGAAYASTASASVTYVTQWGSNGTGNGQFVGPTDLAADPAGTVFVTDLGKDVLELPFPRIQKFSPDGDFLLKRGFFGGGLGGFTSPGGIATGPSGEVYVGDYSLNLIQKFDSNVNFQTEWGHSGSNESQFAAPQGIATDSSGRVYVVDYGNARIQKFGPDGAFLDQWGSFGTGNGQFLSPSWIATGPSGRVYVADSGNSRIQKFNSDGAFLRKWQTPGPGAGAPDYPQGVATDQTGNVYVVGTNSIQKYTSNGSLLTRWGSWGKGAGQFRNPQGIATDSSGNIYIGDSGNSRIQKFHDSGPPYPDPGAARLKVARPATTKIRGGRTGRIKVQVRNTGSSIAKQVELCAPLSDRARRSVSTIPCSGIGSIDAGKGKRATLRVQTRCEAQGKVKLKLKAIAANTDSATAKTKVRITPCRPEGRGPIPTEGLG